MNAHNPTSSNKIESRSTGSAGSSSRAGVRVRTNVKAGPGSGAGGVWLNHGTRVREPSTLELPSSRSTVVEIVGA